MPDQLQLAKNWLPRYTGMPLDRFGDYILLTNFRYHLDSFTETFECERFGDGKPMQAATNDQGLTIINFGIGSPNAATIMDLLSARQPKGVLFLGKCGGLKKSIVSSRTSSVTISVAFTSCSASTTSSHNCSLFIHRSVLSKNLLGAC